MELWFSEKHTDHCLFSVKVKQHLLSEKSIYQQIDVFDTEDFGIILVLDGFINVCQKDEFIYHEMITHVPMASNPDIKSVLIIGGGDGGTTRELLRYDTIEKVDLVEIDEAVVQTALKYLPFTSCMLHHPKLKLYFEDGVNFVNEKNNLYDLIIIDSTDPIGPGEGLFTKEFYQNCYQALTEKGILINQNGSPYYERDALAMIKATKKMESIFDLVKVYQYHLPTYPSGHYLFGFASKKIDPTAHLDADRWNSLGLATKYYNTALHLGAFALPNYVIDLIK
ncbi:polyamine aminopropyltransferase [Candidatus Formimonas warabiya]|uniref:Polyamine aminopropyltransferase n=1 Tax=Formimonas warabiya TaxID=1761012 RepID=A0A3G1L0L5_FORW1|nr:polyamine aminopropyltransferase [Candidatus Formimonas warabiya]ATW28191.1 spermidine synthase [Candidatus Formimonas warabiya]